MLEKLANLPSGIDGVKAVGRVTKEDYERVLEPLFDEARKKGEKVRFLYELGSDFEGYAPGAAWEDARFGVGALRLLAGCAIVSDIAWVRESAKFVGFWLPCPVRVFGASELKKAVEYLRALPEQAGVSHQILPETGVIVVEIKEALRAQDFDALAATADQWIQAQGTLNGIVLHAHHFPGWENLQGLIRHVRFVRDHQRQVKRIALVTDAKLASLVPHLADHFVQAELKQYGYAELDAAIAWAGGAAR